MTTVGGVGGNQTYTGYVSGSSSVTMTKAQLISTAQAQGVTIPETALTKENYTADEIYNLISSYSNTRDTVATMFQVRGQTSGGQPQMTKEAAILDLQGRFPVTGQTSGDKYKAANNPGLVALGQALDAGVLDELAGKGFTRSEIVDIIAGAFGDTGIKNVANSDKFEVPYGHDQAAKDIYSKFITKMSEAALSSPEIAALEGQISQLTDQLNFNISSTKSIDSQIKDLKAQITKLVQDAIDEVEGLEESYKQRAKQTVESQVADYDGTEPYTTFESNLMTALRGLGGEYAEKMASAAQKMAKAQYMFTSITNLVSSLEVLNNSNDTLRSQISDKEGQLAIKKAELANVQPKRTDPIGFNLEPNVRIDFFLDLDENEDISNEMEFLGAENGWAEMMAIDTSAEGSDGAGKVDADELNNAFTNGVNLGDGRQGKLRAVKTELNADGTIKSQTVINDAGQILSGSDYMDLNSYQANGNMFETGNILQGTFDVVKGGATLSGAGYQTLDTLEWLDANYNFTDKDEGVGRFAQGEISGTTDLEEVLASSISLTETESELSEGWAALGLNGDDISADLQAAFTTEQKNKARAIAQNAFGTDVKETGSTSGASSTTGTTYAKFNEKDPVWKKLLDDVYYAGPDDLQAKRNAVLNRLRIANFNKDDVQKVLGLMNDNTTHAVRSHVAGDAYGIGDGSARLAAYEADVNENFLQEDQFRNRGIIQQHMQLM